jgi:hypothetical protein
MKLNQGIDKIKVDSEAEFRKSLSKRLKNLYDKLPANPKLTPFFNAEIALEDIN